MPVSGALFSSIRFCYMGVNRVLSEQCIAFFSTVERERREERTERREERGQPGANLGLQRDYCLLIYSQLNFSAVMVIAYSIPQCSRSVKETRSIKKLCFCYI